MSSFVSFVSVTDQASKMPDLRGQHGILLVPGKQAILTVEL